MEHGVDDISPQTPSRPPGEPDNHFNPTLQHIEDEGEKDAFLNTRGKVRERVDWQMLESS
jgi:hypothetical protein